ncbi:prolipoprotein diacylglyceryl transferase [Ruminococcus sp.]|uniref:prolipoprotein diacylglyceryl transferase n=1 Tax=Ruminococcus sp. TaxID=41978 RepID=UPI0025D4E667|nr:prolipoprotein diacylglyceryl transferase [Ruminococcus sp.]MBR1431067.1 prolipoprotein diacylglyceryl transferase [Ruminococcus sp.]
MNETTFLETHEIQFPELGWKFHIDPTAFTVFGFQIQWYGIIITIGLILALIYVLPRMKRFGLDADRAIDVIIGGVIGGIVGARIYYVLMRWDEYKWDWKAIINTRNGGLAIFGGIIGGILIGYIIARIRKVKALPMLDVVSLGFLIGQGIGRWGNFVNQEAFGTNTDSFLGMTGGTIQRTIADGMSMDGDMYKNGLEMLWEKPVHPCFLYESIWCLLGFVILAFWSKRRKYDGQIFLMYLTWYGAERFLVEGIRTDSLMLGNIRVSQALAAVIFVASVILQIVFFIRRKRDPESFVLYANTEESHRLIEESRRKRMGLSKEDAKAGADSEDDDDLDIFNDDDDDFDEDELESSLLGDDDDDDD